jgi:hypothetical protein
VLSMGRIAVLLFAYEGQASQLLRGGSAEGAKLRH